jgi:hypothetical protein
MQSSEMAPPPSVRSVKSPSVLGKTSNRSIRRASAATVPGAGGDGRCERYGYFKISVGVNV